MCLNYVTENTKKTKAVWRRPTRHIPRLVVVVVVELGRVAHIPRRKLLCSRPIALTRSQNIVLTILTIEPRPYKQIERMKKFDSHAMLILRNFVRQDTTNDKKAVRGVLVAPIQRGDVTQSFLGLWRYRFIKEATEWVSGNLW